MPLRKFCLRAFTFVLLLTGLSSTVGATIQILSSNASSSSSNCDGSVTIEATGSAGPFKVKVGSVEYANVYGNLVIEDLCNGTVTIEVTPHQFPSCTTSLMANLQSSGGGNSILFDPQEENNSTTQTRLIAETRMAEGNRIGLRVTPNPTSGVCDVSFTAVTAVQKVVHNPGPHVIRVLHPNGAVVHQLTVNNAVATSTVNVDLDLSPLPPGVYYLRVLRSDGRVGVERIVIQ